MATLLDIEKDEVNIGARVNKHLVSLLKEADIPISDVVRSGLIYFFTLDDKEKVAFIKRYTAANINVQDIKFPRYFWSDLKKMYDTEEE